MIMIKNKLINCPKCGTRHVINPKKHRFRQKLCKKCRTPIANLKPKRRVLSIFQRRKRERKEATRERFIQRLQMLGHGMETIAKRLTRPFSWEKKDD